MPKKKSYSVLVPATMSISILVEAESEEDAVEAAFSAPFSLKIKMDKDADCGAEIGEFEMHRKVCRGNMFYGVLNEIEVECLDGDDEDDDEVEHGDEE